jgi:hypothetical protein
VTLNANEVLLHLRQDVAGNGPAVGQDESFLRGKTTIAIPLRRITRTEGG